MTRKAKSGHSAYVSLTIRMRPAHRPCGNATRNPPLQTSALTRTLVRTSAERYAVALAPGQDWRNVLLKALAAADAVIILLTERALTSQFVMGEIGAARVLQLSF